MILHLPGVKPHPTNFKAIKTRDVPRCHITLAVVIKSSSRPKIYILSKGATTLRFPPIFTSSSPGASERTHKFLYKVYRVSVINQGCALPGSI